MWCRRTSLHQSKDLFALGWNFLKNYHREMWGQDLQSLKSLKAIGKKKHTAHGPNFKMGLVEDNDCHLSGRGG